MRFLDALGAVRSQVDAISLVAGDPLAHPPLDALVRAALLAAAAHPPALGRYEHYDGAPDLLDHLAASWPLAEGSDRIITAGAQSALTLVQRLAAGAGAGAAYPFGLEFAGAFNQIAVRHVGSLDLVNAELLSEAVSLVDVAAPQLPDGATAGDLVVMSVPNNPTGASWSADQLQGLADGAAKLGIATVFDATYALPGAALGVSFEPPTGELVCTIRSFSKVGLASERVGVLDGPRSLLERLRPLQRAAYIQTPKLGQTIAAHLLRALEEAPGAGSDLAAIYADRWRGAVDILAAELQEPASVVRWSGGPFMFLRCDTIPWGGSDELFAHLLAGGVGVAPGSTLACVPSQAPSASACLRVGIGAVGAGNDNPADSRALLEEGVVRLARGLNSFRSTGRDGR